jgi:endonuclease YncB( thermonuclease family)
MTKTLKVIGYLHSDKEDGKFTKANKHSLVRNSKGELLYVGKKRYIRPICDLGLPPVPPMPKEDEDGIINYNKPKPNKRIKHGYVEKFSWKEFFFTMIAIAIVLLLAAAYANATPCGKGQHRITKVVDGDTFDIEEGRIRLLGLDAYDSMSTRMIDKQAFRVGQYLFTTPHRGYIRELGKNATKFAKDTLLNKCVVLESDYRDKGRYGRLLRYVRIDGMDFGSLLLERGLANAYCGDKKIKRYNEYNELSEFKCK